MDTSRIDLSADLVAAMDSAPSALHCIAESDGLAVMLYVGGEVDMANAETWRWLLAEVAAMTPAPGQLIVDVNGLEFVGIGAYRDLVEQAHRCRQRGIALCLVSRQSIVARVVEICGWDVELPLYSHLDQVLVS